MSDLISKQKAIDEIREFQSQVTLDGSLAWIDGMDEGFDQAVSVIELMDAVEAEPVRRGKWEKYYFDHIAIGERPYVYYCTNCNAVGERTAYCPHCGAKMGEVKYG